MAKVYAVKVGRKTGIFQTWEECQENINGYKGAQFKSFKAIEDANEYLGIKAEEDKKNGLDSDDLDEIKWLLENTIEQMWCGQMEAAENFIHNIADVLEIEIKK